MFDIACAILICWLPMTKISLANERRILSAKLDYNNTLTCVARAVRLGLGGLLSRSQSAQERNFEFLSTLCINMVNGTIDAINDVDTRVFDASVADVDPTPEYMDGLWAERKRLVAELMYDQDGEPHPVRKLLGDDLFNEVFADWLTYTA